MKTTATTLVKRIEKEINDFQSLLKRNKFKAFIVIVVLMILLSFYFFSWKASSDKKTQRDTSIIEQHTEGDQSPVLNVGPGGNANINYGSDQDKSSKK